MSPLSKLMICSCLALCVLPDAATATVIHGAEPGAAAEDGGWLDAQPIEMRLGAQYPVRLFYRRTDASLGSMGVGWRLINTTSDRLEVTLEKSFSANGRNLPSSKGTVLLEPRETKNGGRFFGDEIFVLWDEFFYGEQLQKGERVTGVRARVTVKNRSQEERRLAAERERERAQQQKVEAEREAESKARERVQEQERARAQAQEQRVRLEAQRVQQQRQADADRDARTQRVLGELEAKLAAIQRSRDTAVGMLEALKDHHVQGTVREHAREIERDMRDNVRRLAESRQEPCTTCAGTGYDRCHECSGGFVECDAFLCEGGRVSCLACSGSGSVFGQTCANCKGQRSLACTTCSGTGRELCKTCWTTQLDECGRCGGDGTR